MDASVLPAQHVRAQHATGKGSREIAVAPPFPMPADQLLVAALKAVFPKNAEHADQLLVAALTALAPKNAVLADQLRVAAFKAVAPTLAVLAGLAAVGFWALVLLAKGPCTRFARLGAEHQRPSVGADASDTD